MAMAGKKRKLTSAQIQERLEQSSDSNVSDSEFDVTDVVAHRHPADLMASVRFF